MNAKQMNHFVAKKFIFMLMSNRDLDTFLFFFFGFSGRKFKFFNVQYEVKKKL